MRQYSAVLLRKKLVKTWKKKLPPELRSRLVHGHKSYYYGWLVVLMAWYYWLSELKPPCSSASLKRNSRLLTKFDIFLLMKIMISRHLVLRSVAHTVSYPFLDTCILWISLFPSPCLPRLLPPPPSPSRSLLPSLSPSLLHLILLHPFSPHLISLCLSSSPPLPPPPPGQCDSSAWVLPGYVAWAEPVHSGTLQQPWPRTQRG